MAYELINQIKILLYRWAGACMTVLTSRVMGTVLLSHFLSVWIWRCDSTYPVSGSKVWITESMRDSNSLSRRDFSFYWTREIWLLKYSSNLANGRPEANLKSRLGAVQWLTLKCKDRPLNDKGAVLAFNSPILNVWSKQSPSQHVFGNSESRHDSCLPSPLPNPPLATHSSFKLKAEVCSLLTSLFSS